MTVRHIIQSKILYTNICDAISTYKNENKGKSPHYLVMDMGTYNLLLECCERDKIVDLEKNNNSCYTFLKIPLAISDNVSHGDLQAI